MNVMSDLLFRVIFSALWLFFFANLGWIVHSTRRTTGKQLARHLGWLQIVAVTLAAPYFLGAVLYALVPGWIAVFLIPLPDWFRLVMVGIAAVGLFFAVWAWRVLGKNWAPSVSGVRDDTALVTTGPYGIVRNPIYLGIYAIITSLALVAASWLLLLPGLALCVILYTQMDKEEAALVDRFGDAYREYMKRTPRFIPKLGHDQATQRGRQQ